VSADCAIIDGTIRITGDTRGRGVVISGTIDRILGRGRRVGINGGTVFSDEMKVAVSTNHTMVYHTVNVASALAFLGLGNRVGPG